MGQLSELDATVFPDSKRPKKSIHHHHTSSTSGASFDQLLSFNSPKPSEKIDRFGQAEIIHHPGPQTDYLAPSASSHDHKSNGKTTYDFTYVCISIRGLFQLKSICKYCTV